MVEEPSWFSTVWDSVLLNEPSTFVVVSVIWVVVVPPWFSVTVDVLVVTEPFSPIMVSVVVLALYSTWMSFVVVYALYVAYTVITPVCDMVMLPLESMEAQEPPDVMLHVGDTISWLYLATRTPDVPCIMSEPSMRN